jgi:hypothetical protein
MWRAVESYLSVFSLSLQVPRARRVKTQLLTGRQVRLLREQPDLHTPESSTSFVNGIALLVCVGGGGRVFVKIDKICGVPGDA